MGGRRGPDPNSKRSKLALRRQERIKDTPQWILDVMDKYARNQPLEPIQFPTGGTATNQRQRFYIDRRIMANTEGPNRNAAINALGVSLQVKCTVCERDPRFCDHKDSPARIEFIALPAELMQGPYAQQQAIVPLPEGPSELPRFDPIPTGAPTEQEDKAERNIEQWLKGPQAEESKHVCSEWNIYDACVVCGVPKS